MKTQVISVKNHTLVFHFRYVLTKTAGFVYTDLFFRLLLI